MATKRNGLGRGIDAIFEDNGAPTSVEEQNGVVKELRISDVEPNHAQPRKHFDEEALQELAESIALHGVISPIIVRRQENGRYQIIAGERRWRASKKANLSTIPALIVSYDDRTAMEIALIENLQREDLNPVEESEGYALLQKTYNLSQEEIAQRVGKSRPAVANALRLLGLPKEVLELLKENKLSAGHARAILSCTSQDAMVSLAKVVVDKAFSVRQTEKLSKIWGIDSKLAEPKKPLTMNDYAVKDITKQIAGALSRKVKLKINGKKGILQIPFEDNEDLENLLSQIGITLDL